MRFWPRVFRFSSKLLGKDSPGSYWNKVFRFPINKSYWQKVFRFSSELLAKGF